MKKTTILAFLLGFTALTITTTANAGKLADGLRGIPYGDPAKLLAALRAFPAGDCQNVGIPKDDADAPVCIVNVGKVQTAVFFQILGGRYVGFVMHVKKGYVSAQTLFTSLKAAWGTGTVTEYPTKGDIPYEYLWSDGGVVAKLKYNYFNDEVKVFVIHLGEAEKMNARNEKAAAAGASDL